MSDACSTTRNFAVPLNPVYAGGFSSTTADSDWDTFDFDGSVRMLANVSDLLREVMVDINLVAALANFSTTHDVFADVATLFVQAVPKPRPRQAPHEVGPHQQHPEPERVHRFQPGRGLRGRNPGAVVVL